MEGHKSKITLSFSPIFSNPISNPLLQYAGDCLCREGYCGPRCGECSPGYKGFPLCLPCTCDRAGSTNVDICDDTCVCKVSVLCLSYTCDRAGRVIVGICDDTMCARCSLSCIYDSTGIVSVDIVMTSLSVKLLPSRWEYKVTAIVNIILNSF